MVLMHINGRKKIKEKVKTKCFFPSKMKYLEKVENTVRA